MVRFLRAEITRKDLPVSDEVNDRQEKFCAFYIVNGNATEAAKQAGYSEKTAYSQGQRLLKNVEIQNRVKAHVEEAIITADEVLRGIKGIAIDGEREADQLKAYELLGKHLKLFTDKHEHSNPDGSALAQPIADAMTSFEKALTKIYGTEEADNKN